MKISLKSPLEVYLHQENGLAIKCRGGYQPSLPDGRQALELLGAADFRLKLNNQVCPPVGKDYGRSYQSFIIFNFGNFYLYECHHDAGPCIRGNNG